MEQMKRPSISCYDHCKRPRMQTTLDELDCLPRKSISCLEDLSNELIYEIFEFLDYFHVYEAFFNMNIRFRSLLTNSNLPISISLSSMSKSAFKRYNADIIETNIDRISTLRIFDGFMYDPALSLISNILNSRRIETLVLDNIETQYLKNLLDQMLSLSSLSSLTISTVDRVNDKSTIYRSIVRLPALKYCKLSMEGWSSDWTLQMNTNQYSPIEHLIITQCINLYELGCLLSYVPQLRRLSLHSLQDSSKIWTNICPLVFHQLTHIHFNLNSIKFDQFERLIIDYFSMIHVLRLTSDWHTDSSYLNANMWEQLITFHLPNLRVFDIRFDVSESDTDDPSSIETRMNQFTLPFWIERQWFFSYQFHRARFGRRIMFYSTNPYRRKHYTLYKQMDENTFVHHYEPTLSTVKQVYICDSQQAINCINYFPNATELIFNEVFITSPTSMITILNHIIPLKQLTKLAITCDRFSVQKVIKILCHTPNLHTLALKSMPCYRKNKDYTSIEESKDFQLTSNTNVITNVTCDAECTFEQIRLLTALCPQMQYLTLDTPSNTFEAIVRFLLDKTNPNTCHLFSLCFSRAWSEKFERLNTLIKSETLLDDYILKLVRSKIYLWW